VDEVEHLQRILNEARRMIGSIQPHERNRPTPCEKWDVTGLIHHMIGVCANFTAALQAASPGGGSGVPEPEVDLPTAYGTLVSAVMREWRAADAFERTVRLPRGSMPGSAAIWLLMIDQALHTWDLAKATGRPFSLPDDLASGMLDFMHEWLVPQLRGPGKPFGPEVPCPEDAPIQDRVIAFSGRQP
jgi:uncharacterized protein (TIGR03086 family)